MDVALSFPEIWRGSQNYKSRSRDIGHAPFDLVLHFCVTFVALNPRTKFEVSSFILYRDMEGVLKL